MSFEQILILVNQYSFPLLILISILLFIAIVMVSRLAGRHDKTASEVVKHVVNHIDISDSEMRDRLVQITKNQSSLLKVIRQSVEEERQEGVSQYGDLEVLLKEFREKSNNQALDSEKKLMALQDLLEKQSIYVHDALSELALRDEKRDETVKQHLTSAISGEMKEDRAFLKDSINQSMTLMSDSVGHLSAEVDAKLNQLSQQVKQNVADKLTTVTNEVDTKLEALTQKVQQNFSESLTDTVESFRNLQQQVDALLASNAELDTIGRDVASLSRVMLSKDQSKQESRLADLLKLFMPEDGYSLNASIEGIPVAAILFIEGNERAIAVDSDFDWDMDKIWSGHQETRTTARQDFRNGLEARIRYVAQNFIIENQTLENAIIFISSEAVFAEIQAYHQDVLEMATKLNVWVVSPTTLVAILKVAQNSIKDSKARKQLEKMKEALSGVMQEAQLFESRLVEIGDHVNSALRSVQRAESAGSKLFGRVRNAVSNQDNLPS